MSLPVTLDLHMHSIVSDGTDTPHGILCAVKEKGLELFSLTDHDAVKGSVLVKEELEEIRRKDPDRGAQQPAFITGVEFSCKDEFGKYHILGYHYAPESGEILSLVEKAHSFRMQKVRSRLSFLKDQFGFGFSEEDLNALFSLDNPGKPHIGNLMVKYGYVKTKEEGIHDYIDKKRFAGVYLHPEEAIKGILKAGGIPVLAHPSYGSGDQIIIGEEMRGRVLYLMNFGLQGLEAYYSGFSPKLIEEQLGLAAEFGLYVTAGSDYHGNNKLVTLGSTQLPGPEEWPEGLHRFLEKVL